MTTKPHKTKDKPTWTNLKRHLTDMDRSSLIALIQDLYAASKRNQAFLHARFGLGDDVLKPYKATISRWIYPDVMSNQDISVSKAEEAISDYKKAIGRPEGLAELMVFYCEECTSFLASCGMDDEGYFDALIAMFKQALEAVTEVEPGLRQSLVERIHRIRQQGHNYGYFLGDDMDELIAEYGFCEG